MKINFNTSAIIANKELSNHDKKLSTSIERLSSGYKINHAKDNASGLAIAKRMNAQIRGLTNSTQNASDGISVIETAEGALMEIQDMAQRLNELSVKASTGSITDSDREAIQAEVDQLRQEMERIVRDTEFNGQAILNGAFDLRGYASTPTVDVSYYSDSIIAGEYTIKEIIIDKDADGNLTNATKVDLDMAATPPGRSFPSDSVVTVDKDRITVKGSGGFELTLEIEDLENMANGTVIDTPSATPGDPGTPIKLDLTGIGAMRLQVGANEGQILEVRVPKFSLKTMGIEDMDLSTSESSTDALKRMEGAIAYISGARSRLGAYQNRLERTISSLDITTENLTSAYSRIMDVDMASEMTEYTKYQVLTQAGTSMLTQANERPSQLLQLIQ